MMTVATTGAKSVFVIEDDRFLSSLLKARLEREGFAVSQSFDGEEALNALRTGTAKPDLIVLDLIMPRLSGFEVLQSIAADIRLSKIPVFILTNLAQEIDVQKAKQLGAREYFVKVRSSVDQIITRVKAFLAEITVSK